MFHVSQSFTLDIIFKEIFEAATGNLCPGWLAAAAAPIAAARGGSGPGWLAAAALVAAARRGGGLGGFGTPPGGGGAEAPGVKSTVLSSFGLA